VIVLGADVYLRKSGMQAAAPAAHRLTMQFRTR